MKRIEETSSVDDDSWVFYNVALSKHTTEKDVKKLKWGYSLCEFWELKQVVDIMESVEMASHKDSELESKRNK